MNRPIAVAVCTLAVAACARTSPERQMIDDAAAAMGGRDRILAAKALIIEGDGRNGNLGQDLTPEATTQAFLVSEYTRAIDLDGRRLRIAQTRTPNFAYFQGTAPQTQVFGIDGEVAYSVAANGTATRAPNGVRAFTRPASWSRGGTYRGAIALVPKLQKDVVQARCAT